MIRNQQTEKIAIIKCGEVKERFAKSFEPPTQRKRTEFVNEEVRWGDDESRYSFIEPFY